MYKRQLRAAQVDVLTAREAGMIEQLDELYREVILDHFRNPTHSGELPEAQVKADGANPLCGDELTFHLRLDNGHLSRVRFRGKGCVISQAAASMLAGALEGKRVGEATRLIDAMKALMQGQAPGPDVDRLVEGLRAAQAFFGKPGRRQASGLRHTAAG